MKIQIPIFCEISFEIVNFFTPLCGEKKSASLNCEWAKKSAPLIEGKNALTLGIVQMLCLW
jgi:hypothetical protein